MKKTLTELSAALTAVSCISASMLSASAENYAPVSGTETSFDKYLIMDEDANVPAAEFSFTIEPGSAIAASENGLQVLAGPQGASIVSTAVFTPQDVTYDEVQEGDILSLEENEKYAVQAVAVDFTGVSFDEPGVYRWIIRETALDQPGAIVQDSSSRTLDVYVIDDNGTLKVAGYVLHTGSEAPVLNDTAGSGDVEEQGGQLADKSTGFINRLNSADLSIHKEVSGNQASHDKYFRFTVSITGAGSGTRIAADVTSGAETAPLANSATVYSDEDMRTANNVSELVCDENGTVTHDFYLRHNQTVTLRQIPQGASYTVSEVKEDYLSSSLNETDAETYAANSGTIGADDLVTGFLNTRNGIIPTGITIGLIPYILMTGIGILGIFSVNRNKISH